MVTGLLRILAILAVLAAADAAFASAHDPPLVLGFVAGALALSALGTAVLWTRPLVAAALGWMWLTAAFAGGAFVAGGVDAPGAPAFTNLSSGDSAALLVALAAAFAALGGLFAVRNGILWAIDILLAAYVIVPTAASIGHGGLTAALTTGPLANSRGAYAGAEILLPLAALAALYFAFAYLAKKRGARSAIALVTAIALLAATNLGAYTAGSAQLPTIAAFEHPQPTGVIASGAISPPGAAPSSAATLPSSLPPADWQTADAAQRQANEQTVPTDFLGVSQVDDSVVSRETYGTKAAGAAKSAAQAFGTAAPATPDPTIAKLRDLQAAIPESEYSLEALAATLPNDPVALYVYVRDHVGTDVYAGSMRGPLGAWMNRSANSADKARLLAWLLAKKGIAARFDRGTLSDSERGQIAQAAASAKRPIVPPQKSDEARYFNTRADAGAAFASWAESKLQAAKVALGAGAIDASRVPSRHYWVRVYANGKQLDLDPELASLSPGQHLGTPDSGFKESPMFPADDTMHVRVRLVGKRGAVETILAEKVGAIPDLAYAPLRVGIGAEDGKPNILQTSILFGVLATTGKPISTLSADVPDSLVLQVDRASGDGSTVTVRRTIFDRTRAGSDPAQAMTGLHTIVIAPGSAPMFFIREMFRAADELAENAAALAAHQAQPFAGLYPAPLAAFLMRDDVLASALGTREGIRLFRDRPDLVMLHTTFAGTSGGAAQDPNDARRCRQRNERRRFAIGARDGEPRARLGRHVDREGSHGSGEHGCDDGLAHREKGRHVFGRARSGRQSLTWRHRARRVGRRTTVVGRGSLDRQRDWANARRLGPNNARVHVYAGTLFPTFVRDARDVLNCESVRSGQQRVLGKDLRARDLGRSLRWKSRRGGLWRRRVHCRGGLNANGQHAVRRARWR